ncbi:MAG: FtsL-like putative cell division protein [Anaerolineales bacterium]|jgi:cell division protein FtsL
MERVYSLTQAYSQAPWRKQLQLIGIFLVVLVFFALVAGIYLSVTSRATTVGRQIQGMQADIDRLEQENADLQSQLAFLTSSSVMAKRAQDMGFSLIQMDEPVYIKVPGYRSRQPVTLAPDRAPIVSAAPMVPPEYTESLFQWLSRQLAQSPYSPLKVLP